MKESERLLGLFKSFGEATQLVSLSHNKNNNNDHALRRKVQIHQIHHQKQQTTNVQQQPIQNMAFPQVTDLMAARGLGLFRLVNASK